MDSGRAWQACRGGDGLPKCHAAEATYTKAELGLAIVLAKRQQFDEALETITAVLRRESLIPRTGPWQKRTSLPRVFAELANPSPKDQAEVTARGNPVLKWGAKLRNNYPTLQVSLAVALARKGDDLSRQPEVPASGHEYQPKQELASGAYSWQIVARTKDNQAAFGPVYSFTYHRNLPPSVPREPIKLPAKENAPAKMTLTASDPENDPLTFRVVKAPSKGTLAGTAPNLVYQPGDGSLGEDGFTYVANDGHGDSLPATVQCLVTPDLPADNQQVAVRKNVPKELVLTSVNPRGRSLVYSITSPPRRMASSPVIRRRLPTLRPRISWGRKGWVRGELAELSERRGLGHVGSQTERSARG